MTKKHYTYIKEDSCPYCNCPLDSTTDIGGEKLAKPGDVSICFKCGGFLQFAADLSLIKLSEEEFEKLRPEQQSKLKFIQADIRKYRNQIN